MDKKEPPGTSMTNVEPFPIWSKRVLKGYFAGLLYTQSPKREQLKQKKKQCLSTCITFPFLGEIFELPNLSSSSTVVSWPSLNYHTTIMLGSQSYGFRNFHRCSLL
jgi:hypothetical protein